MEKQYLISKDEYQTVKQFWVSIKEHPAWHHIIYNILRSKPADHGFCIKQGNFQGNDPWYGYNDPLHEVKAECSTVNAWAVQKGTSYDRIYQHVEEKIAQRKKAFKATFGIDLPEGFIDLLGGNKS